MAKATKTILWDHRQSEEPPPSTLLPKPASSAGDGSTTNGANSDPKARIRLYVSTGPPPEEEESNAALATDSAYLPNSKKLPARKIRPVPSRQKPVALYKTDLRKSMPRTQPPKGARDSASGRLARWVKWKEKTQERIKGKKEKQEAR